MVLDIIVDNLRHAKDYVSDIGASINMTKDQMHLTANMFLYLGGRAITEGAGHFSRFIRKYKREAALAGVVAVECIFDYVDLNFNARNHIHDFGGSPSLLFNMMPTLGLYGLEKMCQLTRNNDPIQNYQETSPPRLEPNT
tara:strand:+ start:2625 stop:3044 length:420 start_codon:yes stop_codon:yes gene_type:complete